LIEFNVKRAAILTAFDPDVCKGGIETFIQNLKSLLTERNIKVDTHFIYPEPTLLVKPFPLRSLGKRIPEILLNCFMLGRAFSKIEKDYDLVISNNFYGLGYFAPKVKSFNVYHSTHAGYADALRGKIPDSDYRKLKYLFGYMGDSLSGRSKGKIAACQAVGDELRRYYKFRKVSVVHHSIDTAFFKKIDETARLKKKWNISPDDFVGIFVGRWEAGKGVDILSEIIRMNQDIIWILVTGPSCPESAMNNVRVMNAPDNIILRELYSLSDFMLFPSYYEGFGFVMIEAMSCELPVICTQVGLIKDLLQFEALRKLTLPIRSKQEMIGEILDRITLLKKAGNKKKEIIILGRSVVEKEYSADIWKSKIAMALGLEITETC